jgi:hypothetical protein
MNKSEAIKVLKDTINELKELIEQVRGPGESLLESRIEALQLAIESLQGGWISVDTPPKLHKNVNVKLKDGKYTHSWLHGNGYWAYNINPTHWQPIQPPTDKGD